MATHSASSCADDARVPCEHCGQQIPWSEYGAHVAEHEAEFRQRQTREETRLQQSHEPDDIALQVVAMVRKEGKAFDGGRDICNFDVVARFVRQMHEFADAEGSDRAERAGAEI